MNNTAKKVFVTGGGGFLGRYLCRLLINQGYLVVSYSRGSYDFLDALGVQHIQGSLQDLSKMQQAMEGCEAVFHTAAKAGIWGKYQDYYQANVVGTENVIRACQNQEIKYLIYTSSPSVIYHPEGVSGANEELNYPSHFKGAAYPETKAAAEKLIRLHNNEKLKTVSLRPHLIWGPEDHHFLPRLLEKKRSGRLRIIGAGQNRVDHIYVENAALAHVQAWHALMSRQQEVSGKVYFISQDEPWTIETFINSFLNCMGETPVTKRIPIFLAKLLAIIFEFIYKIFSLAGEPPLTRFVVDQMSTDHWFDISAAKKDLNFNPEVSSQEGLARLRAWWLERHF